MMLTDAQGHAHRPVDTTPRIASLVPSITDLLFSLGLGDQRLQRADQPGGRLAHREAPVVGEDLDLMAACQEFDQRPVERVDQPDRRDAVATHGDLLQAALEQRPVIEPDRIVAGR